MVFLDLMNTTVDTRFFRAGVGTVIYNDEDQVVLFERAKYPIGVWQFQQGGIDIGESTENTLWRELKEEVGLFKSDFSDIHELPFWTVYQEQHTIDDTSKSRLGQAHKWYFLKLNPEVEIDLSKAEDDEASAFKWVTFTEAIAVTNEHKKHVYQSLETYFFDHIKPKL